MTGLSYNNDLCVVCCDLCVPLSCCESPVNTVDSFLNQYPVMNDF